MAGQRPNTDFVDGGTAGNQDRRRKYLEVCASLLKEHLKLMVDEWDPNGGGNYRETFLALDQTTALKNILTGIAVLTKSELAGERIFTAYDNRDQEDEHSCFSDNTHRDTRQDAQGVKNVFLGSYTKVDGTLVSGKGLFDIVDVFNPTLAESIKLQMDVAFTSVDINPTGFIYDKFRCLQDQIPLLGGGRGGFYKKNKFFRITNNTHRVNNVGIPFDYAINDDAERPKVVVAVNELRTLGDSFAAAATTLGFSINTGLPD
jgi:putative iron-regulated protein